MIIIAKITTQCECPHQQNQLTAVSPAIDNRNTTSRNHQTIVASQTIEENNNKGRKRFWPDNESISYSDGSRDKNASTILTAE